MNSPENISLKFEAIVVVLGAIVFGLLVKFFFTPYPYEIIYYVDARLASTSTMSDGAKHRFPSTDIFSSYGNFENQDDFFIKYIDSDTSEMWVRKDLEDISLRVGADGLHGWADAYEVDMGDVDISINGEKHNGKDFFYTISSYGDKVRSFEFVFSWRNKRRFESKKYLTVHWVGNDEFDGVVKQNLRQVLLEKPDTFLKATQIDDDLPVRQLKFNNSSQFSLRNFDFECEFENENYSTKRIGPFTVGDVLKSYGTLVFNLPEYEVEYVSTDDQLRRCTFLNLTIAD